MKASSAVNYLYKHTDDGGVEALLFAVKRLTTAVCVYPVAKCGEKSYTTVIVWLEVFTCLYCTSLMRLELEYTPHVLIWFVFTSIMN